MTDVNEQELMARLRRKIARATNAVHTVQKNATANLGEKIGDVHFANLGAVLTEIKAALQEEAVSLQQPFTVHPTDPPVMTVDTILTDAETGMYLMYGGPGFPVKSDPQAAGGAITYFRRYALVSLFGLIVEDDDAVEATRQARDPHRRTKAEGMIRDWLAGLPGWQVSAFASDFQEAFGSTLTNLPTGRHGDALAFQKEWVASEPHDPTPEPGE